MPEVSDEEYQLLLGSKQLMDGLLKSPKTKRAQEKLIKELHPGTVISEDHEAPLRGEIEAIQKKLDDYLLAQNNKQIDGELARDFGALRGEGFTDDGIEAVKKIMVERHIPSPIDAASVWRRLNPVAPAAATTDFSTSWKFGQDQEADEDRKLLYKDDDSWLDKMVPKILNEAKQGKFTD